MTPEISSTQVNEKDILVIERPDSSLFTYYVISTLITGPLFPFIIIPLYFRYHTMRFRFSEEGVHGHNTDAPGVALAIEKFGPGRLDDRRVVIFGAGGAGRAAALGVLEGGAASVVFCELIPSKAEAGVSRLRSQFPDRDLATISMSEEDSAARQIAVIGEQDQPLTVEIEPSHGVDARCPRRQEVGNRGPATWI